MLGGTIPEETGFEFANAGFSSPDFKDAIFVSAVDDAMGMFTTTADIPAGDYTGVISNLGLSDTAGTYSFGLSSNLEGEAVTESDEFIITSGLTNFFTDISVSGNAVAGAKSDHTYTVTSPTLIPKLTNFFITWSGSHFNGPDASGFNYSNIAVSSDDFPNLICEAMVGLPSILSCAVNGSNDFAAGSYDFTLTKVVNPSIVGDYTPAIALEMDLSADYTNGKADFTTHNVGKLKKKKIKIKKKKSRRPQIKLTKRKLDTNWVKLKLFVKKSSKIEASAKKKWKRKKTFNYKKLKKRPKKKWFKGYKKFQARVKVCYRYNDKKANEICGGVTKKTFKLPVK